MNPFENIPFENLPRVTILIANRNYGEYLKDAVMSALDQDYPKCDICIIDDYSEDDSWQKIYEMLFKGLPHDTVNGCKYRKDGDRVISALQTGVPLGPSGARNFGIEQTKDRTDIYAVLDADDIMYRNKVSKCVTHMLTSDAVGAVYGDYDILNTETKLITREYKEPFSRKRLTQECIVHSGSVIRKTALEAVKESTGYYDDTMRTCEDYDLWMRISEKFIIFHVAEPLTTVRVQPKNSTVTVDKSIWERNWQRVFQKAQARHG